MSPRSDIIAAIATAPGRGGIGVVRVSGHGLAAITKVLTGRQLIHRLATYTEFFSMDGTVLDKGIALYFPAPYSYTGEEVLELQGHGGTAVLQSVLERCLELGARLAEPGEFTKRAFLNDKMDLTQAESVADLINATSQEAARSAIRSLQGDFSSAIHTVVAKLIDLRILVEAVIDFPEEEGLALFDQRRISEKLASIQSQIREIEKLAKLGSILREGAQVVLVGAPNVGKSSLLNRLAGESVALVSEVPGTTRDAIREALQIKGVPLHIIDTAGIRETDDLLENMGIDRTQQNIEQADLILVLTDETSTINIRDEVKILERIPSAIPRLFVHNKIDLTGQNAHTEVNGTTIHLYLSAKTGQGIDSLQDKILEMIGWHQESGIFMARARHLEALAKANNCLFIARQQLESHELLAEELRQTQNNLNQITGEFVADDLLGEIFSRFCIGK